MSDYFNLNEGIKDTKKRFTRFSNITTHKYFNRKAIIPLLIALAIPLTVGLALVEQETRSRASEPTPPITPVVQNVPIKTLPVCTQTSIPPQKGAAPLNVTLYGGGIAGGEDSLIDGYQWDFDGNGTWDSNVQVNPITHAYLVAGKYKPKYRILGSNGDWSQICDYSFEVVVGK